MTQQEFESRTQVKVSINEWLAIDQIYSLSDVDKDTFCKLWCKMNPVRVKAAKEQRKALAKEQANREYAWCLVNYGYTTSDWFTFADEYFTAKQRDFIENRLHIPFVVETPDGHSYRHFVNGVIAKVNEYLFGK